MFADARVASIYICQGKCHATRGRLISMSRIDMPVLFLAILSMASSILFAISRADLFGLRSMLTSLGWGRLRISAAARFAFSISFTALGSVVFFKMFSAPLGLTPGILTPLGAWAVWAWGLRFL